MVVFVVLSVGTIRAQHMVKGKVVSADDGEPVPYATVLIKGQGSGTTTDENGFYALGNLSASSVLVFSYVGYTTQEVIVGNRKIIDISLASSAYDLDEVMVVAYGSAKKATFTGAASLVKADEIKDIPTASFESSLSGRVAGLQISPGSGQAGSVGSIRIRGTGSMNATNEPLYVIDGVPVISGDVTELSYVSNNVMSTLNPSDIESITVLKDAAASALYGSRAANGVILIPTKRGR